MLSSTILESQNPHYIDNTNGSKDNSAPKANCGEFRILCNFWLLGRGRKDKHFIQASVECAGSTKWCNSWRRPVFKRRCSEMTHLEATGTRWSKIKCDSNWLTKANAFLSRAHQNRHTLRRQSNMAMENPPCIHLIFRLKHVIVKDFQLPCLVTRW